MNLKSLAETILNNIRELKPAIIIPIPIILSFKTPPDDETRAFWMSTICRLDSDSRLEKINMAQEQEHLSSICTEVQIKAQRLGNLQDANLTKTLGKIPVLRYPQEINLRKKHINFADSINKDTCLYCPGDCSICTYASVRDLKDKGLNTQIYDTTTGGIRK